MELDTRRDDLGLLLLAALATGCFAFDAAGHAGGSAFLAGLLANFLSQRYWKRERNRPDRPALRTGSSAPRWMVASFAVAMVASLSYAKWMMPGLRITAALAVCSAVDMPAPFRRLTARRTPGPPTAF